MTMIVGYAPDERGKAALHLASMLARSVGDDLVVCSVVPAPWVPGMAQVDAEYREYLDEIADAGPRPGPGEPARATYRRRSSGTARGPRAVGPARAGRAARRQRDRARFVVAGAFGHVALGSVTDRLLHSSPVTIALAPRGFRCKPDPKVTRVTAAYGGSASADEPGASRRPRVAAQRRRFAADRVVRGVGAPGVHRPRLGTDSEDAVLAGVDHRRSRRARERRTRAGRGAGEASTGESRP